MSESRDKQSIDLLIENAVVVTGAGDTYANGAVAVAGNRIAAVGDAGALTINGEPRQRMDARGGLVLPGLIDAHVHPGLAIAGPLLARRDWRTLGPLAGAGRLAEFMVHYGRLDRHAFGEEESYATSKAVLLAGLKSGMTCFSDGGIGNPAGIARAAADLGIRGIVTHARSQDLGWEPGDAPDNPRRIADTDAVLADAATVVARWNGTSNGRIRAWYTMGTELSCSDDLVRGIKRLADRDGVGFSSHTSAAGNQDALSLAIHGRTGVARLDALGALGSNWVGVHMGFLTDEEMGMMARSGASVAHCPGTSMGAGKSIITRGTMLRLLEAGVTVALGSDSYNSGTIVQQLPLAFMGHKEAMADDRVMAPEQLLAMVTRDAARALLWDDQIGTLAPGMMADIIIVRTDSPRHFAFPDPLHAFVRIGQPDDVDTVIVDGEVLVRGGSLVHVDEADVLAGAKDAMTGFVSAMNR